MELKPGTLKHLQQFADHKITEYGFNNQSLHERMLLLTEEVGELAKACRKISGMYVNKDDKNSANPGEEVADVLIVLLAVATKLDLDIEKEVLAKLQITDQRQYNRTSKS